MLHLPKLASEPSFALPRISAFYGIAIYMYYRDHSPPHLQARYGGDEAEVAMKQKWRSAHRKSLLARCRNEQSDWLLSGSTSTVPT